MQGIDRDGANPEERLRAMGIQLPEVSKPVASYVSWRTAGQLLFLSGQGPRDAAGNLSIGKVGQDCSVERAKADARQIGLQLLASIRQAVGSLDRVEAIVKLLGMVNAVPEFTEHPKVIDGCSEVLNEVLGERGRHARSAVGMGSLPNGMTVEIEAVVLISDDVSRMP
jgi:enamine deaminase RidA (YjgF/YER057c/UK114 family)